jgi:hypothetical protein
MTHADSGRVGSAETGSREPSPQAGLAASGFDPARIDINALRESIALEDRADLMASACQFGDAAYYMKQANRIRERQFGRLDPNRLRALTAIAMSAGTAKTEGLGSEGPPARAACGIAQRR